MYLTVWVGGQPFFGSSKNSSCWTWTLLCKGCHFFQIDQTLKTIEQLGHIAPLALFAAMSEQETGKAVGRRLLSATVKQVQQSFLNVQLVQIVGHLSLVEYCAHDLQTVDLNVSVLFELTRVVGLVEGGGDVTTGRLGPLGHLFASVFDHKSGAWIVAARVQQKYETHRFQIGHGAHRQTGHTLARQIEIFAMHTSQVVGRMHQILIGQSALYDAEQKIAVTLHHQLFNTLENKQHFDMVIACVRVLGHDQHTIALLNWLQICAVGVDEQVGIGRLHTGVHIDHQLLAFEQQRLGQLFADERGRRPLFQLVLNPQAAALFAKAAAPPFQSQVATLTIVVPT
ncbi:hypothetical protein BpHYR1_019065 [Brachionus plicatilis]|uniref:Uncharacterized protein n=1 Tax=Brachionus plicatilis TaxID=10195 RepID=A0A3M7SFE8_BRAPC|nr:hypothetical protein BpHYR1_019065 [Brachionus plicatilis]